MKRIITSLALGALLTSTTGCQTVADHNTKAQADQEAGRLAAIEGRKAAQQALEATKGIVPATKATP